MQVSEAGTRFIASHEGFASKAYLCPAGVLTIGYGFTMRSKVCAAWWQATHGRLLQKGDTITRRDADTLLQKLLNEEYGKAVPVKVGALPQNQHDAATSVSFNCGTGALGWKWAVALKQRLVAQAAALLRTTATTANGRQLAGLVRRRKEEARLLETGDYGPSGAAGVTPASRSTAPVDVRWYQTALKTLGYDINVDGNPLTGQEPIRKFQKDHGLLVDGAVGPATRAALIRALDAKNGKGATAAGGATTGTAAGGTEAATSADPAVADVLLATIGWGLVAAACIAALYIAYRYRGRVTGQRVPT